MDERAVRFWGVIVGGGCIAAALGVATLTGPRDPPPVAAPTASSAPPAPAPATPAAPAPSASDATNVKAADAGAAPAQAGGGEAVTFVVRFAPGHPLARAQELEAQGRHAAAVQAAHAGLRTRRELRGLCYDRFTLGGAEIVLRLCAPIPDAERAAAQQRWSARLAAMSGVEYAEPNVILQPERRR